MRGFSSSRAASESPRGRHHALFNQSYISEERRYEINRLLEGRTLPMRGISRSKLDDCPHIERLRLAGTRLPSLRTAATASSTPAPIPCSAYAASPFMWFVLHVT